ncbi:MAG: hypothetical protein KatS3mg102_0454 [Planctomycetota bacterium]|nr:MAG: hypothetical protein KatS3mg102_0454 [Planctomycetota bacterium]
MSGWRCAALGTALLCLGSYLALGPGRPRVVDEYMVWFQARGLLARGELAVPEAERLGIWFGKRARDGQPHAPYGPAHALVLAPLVAAGPAFARALGVPPAQADLVEPFPATLLSSLAAALAAGLLAALAVRLGAPPRGAVLLGLALGLGSSLATYAGTLFSEPLTSLLLLGALAALERAGRRVAASGPAAAVAGSEQHAARPAAGLAEPAASAGAGWAALAGSFLGVALLMRVAHAIAAPAFCLGFALLPGRTAQRLRRTAACAAPVAAALALALARNASLYGHPLDWGYPDMAELGHPVSSFQTPLLVGLYGFVLSPGKSVLLYAPAVVLGLCGLRQLVRRRLAVAVVAGGVALSYLLFYARFTHWEGGYCYGPRYLVPVLGLVLVGAAPLLGRRRARGLLVALLVLGVLVNLPGLLTSFLEEQRGSGRYYDAALCYRLDYPGALAQARLAVHYLERALAEGPLAAPLGKGLDLGVLHLRRAGASPLVGWALVGLAAILWVVGLLAVRSCGREPEGARP